MNHTKYRIWLISIAVIAAVFGIFYCVYTGAGEEEVMDGTFVQREERLVKELPA